MRDPKRIERIMPMLAQVWRDQPDLRLGQLMDFVHSLNEDKAVAAFYVEDDKWEELLKKLIGVRAIVTFTER